LNNADVIFSKPRPTSLPSELPCERSEKFLRKLNANMANRYTSLCVQLFILSYLFSH